MSAHNVKEKRSSSERAMIKAEIIKKYGALFVFLIIVLIDIIITKNFLSIDTLWNLLIQATPTILIGIGLTFVIATAGIDISVGSTMALSSVVTVMLLPVTGVVPAIIIGLSCGVLTGIFTGLMVVKFNIQPIVITLAMMIVLRAVARIISDAKNFMVTDKSLTSIGLVRVGGIIPIQIIYIVFFVAVFTLIAKYSVFGKSVEAIGNNKNAALLCGINVSLIIVVVYALVSLLSGMAGILTVARSGSCNSASLGELKELDSIAAVVIGATRMEGGKPQVFGTMIGCLIITLITMTVNMNNIPYEYSLVIKAAIIIFVVYLQRGTSSVGKKIKTTSKLPA